MVPEEQHIGPVLFLPGRNRGRYPCCHSYYIEGPGILIDPGSSRDRLKRLKDEGPVTTVWLSHWHEDHFRNLDLFDDLPFYVSEPDAVPLSSLEELLAGYDIETEFPYWKRVMEHHFNFRPRKPAGYLKGGETQAFGNVTIDVIATPGHTPGHLSFYFREAGALFLGDYDLTPFGPWYGDHSASIEGTIETLHRLRTLPAKVWLTSHERGIFDTPPPAERWEAYEGVIHRREAALLAALENALTFEEIVALRIVYGRPREPRESFEFGERSLMRKHLERLTALGRVVRTDGRYIRADRLS